jgi:DNA-3-methyladenine glycosylase I
MAKYLSQNKRKISKLSSSNEIASTLPPAPSIRRSLPRSTSSLTSLSPSSSSERKRCPWAHTSSVWLEYHDTFWGIPCHDEKLLYEMLNLSGMQAGLTWKVILGKRESYRLVFDNWDPNRISQYDDDKITELLSDSRIIRNRLKIKAIVNNAKAYLKLREEYGGLDHYLWSYVPNKTPIKSYEKKTTSPLSEEISKDLKKRKFQFVGPTIIYAYLQSIGVINDHEEGCFLR